jgi:hypothetical protein
MRSIACATPSAEPPAPGACPRSVDQLGELASTRGRCRPARAGGVGQLGALDHPCVLRSIAATASWVSVWIVLTSAAICLVGLGRALGQPLHLLGHHREAAAGLAGRSGLDRGVQRQHVGLLGDVGDQLDDLADLLRARPAA